MFQKWHSQCHVSILYFMLATFHKSIRSSLMDKVMNPDLKKSLDLFFITHLKKLLHLMVTDEVQTRYQFTLAVGNWQFVKPKNVRFYPIFTLLTIITDYKISVNHRERNWITFTLRKFSTMKVNRAWCSIDNTKSLLLITPRIMHFPLDLAGGELSQIMPPLHLQCSWK